MSALGRRNRSNDWAIAQFEDAANSGRPIVLWVKTDSSDRRQRRNREQSQQFFDNVLNTPAATAELADCLCLWVDGADLDRDFCREYDISRNRIPQLVIYDFNGEKLFSVRPTVSPEQMAEAIQEAKERCEALLERR